MKKVRCHDPKYLKGEKKQEGYNCKHFDHDRKICLRKKIGGGKPASVFPSKSRRCSFYQEKEKEA